jgi:hypothetical protein
MFHYIVEPQVLALHHFLAYFNDIDGKVVIILSFWDTLMFGDPNKNVDVDQDKAQGKGHDKDHDHKKRRRKKRKKTR